MLELLIWEAAAVYFKLKWALIHWHRRCWTLLNTAPVFWTCVQNISKKVFVSGSAPTRVLITQVKTGLGSGLSLSMSLFHRSKKNATCQKGADVVTMRNGGRARLGNWKGFLPDGVCTYKYAHEQSCTFCTLRQGLLPSFGLFPVWLRAAWGAGYTESCERFYTHLCHLLGAVAVCDDGLGLPGFDDRTAFCLFSLITVVWGCYLCVLSSGMIVLNVSSFSWYLLWFSRKK